MAGLHYIKPDLIDLQFWTKLPLKFSAVKHYDKSLVSLPVALSIVPRAVVNNTVRLAHYFFHNRLFNILTEHFTIDDGRILLS